MPDNRLLRIGIEINGRLQVYEGLAMYARGSKYANANQNDCEITITNLSSVTRDQILSDVSPFNNNRTPKSFIVEAGRESYGYSKVFSGTIASATPSQPPDINLVLKALTKDDKKGEVIARSMPESKLSSVARNVAKDLGVTLQFEATDKVISNYNFTGGALKQVDELGKAGNVDVYVDDDLMIVKDTNKPLTNQIRILNIDTGLIGIPEITEQGIKVKFMFDNQTKLGGMLRVQSKINPATSGDYIIYKLSFDLSSRDNSFYWIAEAKRA